MVLCDHEAELVSLKSGFCFSNVSRVGANATPRRADTGDTAFLLEKTLLS